MVSLTKVGSRVNGRGEKERTGLELWSVTLVLFMTCGPGPVDYVQRNLIRSAVKSHMDG